MTDIALAKSNLLLAALPEVDLRRLAPQLEVVQLALGESIYEADRSLKHLYFPMTAVISLLYVMHDGASAEIAVAGREGVVGVSLFMGGDTTPSRAIVQSAGEALLLKANVLKEEFRRGGELQRLLLRYTQALITQMSQTAVCNRHHSVEQQLCRWLLLSVDRLDTNQLTMTQQLIADMLGVRREGVTEAAGKLQAKGSIEYRRGRITVRDRGSLERCVCECYQVVKKEYDRLLGPQAAASVSTSSASTSSLSAYTRSVS
ncbi:MAG: Crp/Fnr family transcriptional regulator [Casimicrobiaceae bacterium]